MQMMLQETETKTSESELETSETEAENRGAESGETSGTEVTSQTDEEKTEGAKKVLQTFNRRRKRRKKKPAVKQQSKEVEEQLKDSVSAIIRLHSKLSDCHRSLFYLENCFKVSRTEIILPFKNSLEFI